MRAAIPTSLVDNSYENFPEGTYMGAIDSAEVRDVKNDGSWITLKIGLSDIKPFEGTSDPGRSRFQAEITLTTDGVNLFEVTNWADKNVPFGIRKTAGLLAGLAEGLGVAQRTPAGVECDLEAVVDGLTTGQFAGERVGFEVVHYSPKNSDKTYDQVNRFGAAG